ncbi:hypothetical protein [Branchiibius sp. NY16-3462-2]|uniref:hypothetical protein n=1 Tax=Branchiibius sp. NY16-3462-2 TaxID=1807500 RepID=UPI0025BFF8AA|nr:hypothetical protein [Branchiibius sp. NY16-3462-2]
MADHDADTHQGQPLPDMPTPARQRPRWSAAEAARRCGVGRATIQRALEDGRIANAEKTDDGWQIPVESLLAAGFKPTAQPVVKAEDPTLIEGDREHDRAPSEDARTAELRAQIEALTKNLDAERARREHAEQDAEHAREIAAERGRHIETFTIAMRLLEPTKPAPPEAPSPSMRPDPNQTTGTGAPVGQLGPVKRWLRRR